MPTMVVRGANELRAVGADLRRAGSPGRGVRYLLRRNLTAAAKPVQKAAQAGALAIPASGDRSTGLRRDISAATRIRIMTGGKNAMVRIWVNPGAMKTHPGNLPSLEEGLSKWRHPVYGNDGNWVDQASHPYFHPAVDALGITVAQAAAVLAIREAAAMIDRGI